MDIIISAIYDNENYDNIIKQLLENSPVDNLFKYFDYKNPLQICFERRGRLIKRYMNEYSGSINNRYCYEDIERYKEDYEKEKSEYKNAMDRYGELFNSFMKYIKSNINHFDKNNNHIVINALYGKLEGFYYGNYDDEYESTYKESTKNMIVQMLNSPYLDYHKKADNGNTLFFQLKILFVEEGECAYIVLHSKNKYKNIKIDINALNNNGQTILMDIIINYDKIHYKYGYGEDTDDLFDIIIKEFSDKIKINIQDKYNMTLLMYALELETNRKKNKEEIIKSILSYPDINFNLKNDKDETVFMIAKKHNIRLLDKYNK
jgi:hypothetical protein